MDSARVSATLKTVLRPTLATTVVAWLVVGTVCLGLLLPVVRLLARWIRMYWILRHMKRPTRVCPGYWFVPELIVVRYWIDTHLSMAARFFNFLQASAATYGENDLVVFFNGPQALVVTVTPAAVEALVNSSNNTNKPFIYHFMEPAMGTGLIVSEKNVWKPRRKTINPAFHARNLDSYVPIMSRRLERFARKLEVINDSASGYFNIMAPVRAATFGVLMETVFGISDIEDEEFEKKGHIKRMQTFCDGFISRICNVAYWWDFIYELSSEGKNHHSVSRILRDYCRQIITARKEELMDKGHVRNSTRSFLDILLQMHMQDQTLTESEILDETITILGAGFDTTASSAAFCLYLLGNHLEVQEKVHEELDRVFGDDVDRPVTLDDLRDLPYLDCVIKETLRLYPSVPVVARRIDEDMKIGEQLIPKGAVVATLIYFLQRHQKFYDEPNSFVPERFQENNGRHQYAYIPFFGGQRNCIGQRFAVLKAKVLVAQVMRRFNIESKLPESELQLEIGIVLRPSQNLDVKLIRRNRTL
ncbi:unnamed protein product [Ixodes pacificus]